MNEKNQVIHTLKRGEDLYQVAQNYQTDVIKLLTLNPGIDPYKLSEGEKVVVCPNSSSENCKVNVAGETVCALREKMRLAWLQNVYWSRMRNISIAARLRDEQSVTSRLMQNPADIANIFGEFYSHNDVMTLTGFFSEQLELEGKLITALRDGQKAEAEQIQRSWYANADTLAKALSTLNPAYRHDDVQDMFYRLLDLTTQEILMRLQGQFSADIVAFNKVESEALNIADYLSSGLVSQFADKFSI